MSSEVPEGLGYMWQVLERGEAAYAEVWQQPHAAAAAAKIESLPVNLLRAIALSQVYQAHQLRDQLAADDWASDRIDFRSWLD